MNFHETHSLTGFMEVKGLKDSRSLIRVVIMLVLALALIRIVNAQSPNETQTFLSKDKAGLQIVVNATRETVPGGNITVDLWINCTSDGVKVDCLNVSFFGFKCGQEKTVLNTTSVASGLLPFNSTIEYNGNLSVPSDVWDATYCELRLRYSIKELVLEYEPTFPMTVIRNVPFEELKEQFNSLNESYHQLSSDYEQLNQTYTELEQNYTSLKGSANDLASATQVAVVLGITTVFFVGTTIYMVIRKPKDYW
jgi:hypothetical protein